jgi:hypothetical protein
LAGNAGSRVGSKEEFVVFSAVQGLIERCAGVQGEGGCLDLGVYAGFLADVGQVGGKAVAEVDGGGGQVTALQPEPLGDARLGVEVRGEKGFQTLGDAGWLAEPRLGSLRG